MATPKANEQQLVSRTYRAAVRIGEDFITIEETITLPTNASDADVAQAVDLGLRIYRAQREAVESQISTIRETAGTPTPYTVRDPDSPASDKQRNYIAALQEDLAWNNEQLSSYASEQSVDLVTMTKGQASTFIDGLKKLSEERGQQTKAAPQQPAPRTKAANEGQPAADRQISALERLASQQGLDLDTEARNRYAVAARGMTFEQAGALLREWQPSQNRRATNGELPF